MKNQATSAFNKARNSNILKIVENVNIDEYNEPCLNFMLQEKFLYFVTGMTY